MAHSHSRTLLAKMGFGDPDLKNTRHDLACNYIGLNKEVLTATLQAAMPPDVTVGNAAAELEFMLTKGEGKYSTTVGFVDVLATYTATKAFPVREPLPPEHKPLLHHVLLEKWQAEDPHLAPWIGKEKEMPPLMARRLEEWRKERIQQAIRETEKEREEDYARYQAKLAAAPVRTAHTTINVTSVIEVKIQRVTFGDLIRQMRLYNEHIKHPEQSPNYHLPWDSRPTTMFMGYDEPRELGEKQYYALLRTLRPTVVVIDYDIDDTYAKAIASAGITAVRLGAGFQRFVESNNASSTTPKKLTEI